MEEKEENKYIRMRSDEKIKKAELKRGYQQGNAWCGQEAEEF